MKKIVKAKVRRVRKGDWKRCSEVVRLAVSDIDITLRVRVLLRFKYTVWNIARMSRVSEMFVFEKDGDVQGSGRLDGEEIGMIYVNPEYWRQGIGTTMVRHLEGVAKKKGLKRVYVRALLPAVGFYKKLGYKRAKCKGRIFCVMEKRL